MANEYTPITPPTSSNSPEGSVSAPPSVHGQRKRLWALLGIIAFLVIIATSLWFVLSSRRPERLATISLSNQQEIYLGQSAKDAAKALGRTSPIENADLLEYPVPIDLTHPLEATVYLHEKRVVGVRINRNKDNVDKQTGIYPGMTLEEVKTKTNGQVQPIVQPMKYGRAIGLIKEDNKIKSYYLVNACISRADRVQVIVIAEKGFEERALELGAGCNGRGN